MQPIQTEISFFVVPEYTFGAGDRDISSSYFNPANFNFACLLKWGLFLKNEIAPAGETLPFKS